MEEGREGHDGKRERGTVFTAMVIVMIVVANLLTLALVVTGVVVPYIQEITAYNIENRAETSQGSTSTDYCIYFTEGMNKKEFPEAHASLVWTFVGTENKNYEDWLISFIPTWWYDTKIYVDRVPEDYYIFGIFEKDNYTIGTSPDGTNNTLFPNVQNFFVMNAVSDQVSLVCMYLDPGNMFPLEWYLPVENMSCSNMSNAAMGQYYGYDPQTQLLYQILAVDRPVTSNDNVIPNIYPGKPLQVFMAELNSNNFEVLWWNIRTVDFYNPSQLCLGDTIRIKRTYLATNLISDTGYNINVILTLNYMILLLIFRNNQPVKSRLPLLIFNAGLLFIASFVVEILNIIVKGINYQLESNLKSLYLPTSTVDTLNNIQLAAKTIQQVLAAFCMLIYSLHIARYYYLKNLYSFIAKKEKIKVSDLLIHRKLTSNIAFAIYSTVILIIILAVFIPLTITKSVEVFNSVSIEVLEIIVYFIRAVVLIVIAICFFVEIILNAKTLIQKGYRSIFWFFGFSDPFYFRTEMLLFFFMWLLIHPAFGIDMRIYYLRNNAFTIDPYSPFFTRGAMASQILYEIYSNFYLNFLICGGAVCVIQIFVWLRQKPSVYVKLENGKSEMKIIEVLLDEDGYKLMDAYCATEWSTENLRCWKDIYAIQLKGTGDPEEILQIYQTYIIKGSDMEVNIPAKTRKAFIEMFGPNGEKIVSAMSFTVFNDLYNQVLVNLSDTFSRLSSTDEYIQMEQKKKLLREAMNEYI
jgi:hypothetical protein